MSHVHGAAKTDLLAMDNVQGEGKLHAAWSVILLLSVHLYKLLSLQYFPFIVPIFFIPKYMDRYFDVSYVLYELPSW